MEGAVNLFSFAIPLILLVLGYAAGKIAESRHYRRIREREQRHLKTPAVTWKTLVDTRPVKSVRLASGSVVVSVDYYKRFLMAFRRIFGGEVRSYAPLLDRADGKRSYG